MTTPEDGLPETDQQPAPLDNFDTLGAEQATTMVAPTEGAPLITREQALAALSPHERRILRARRRGRATLRDLIGDEKADELNARRQAARVEAIRKVPRTHSQRVADTFRRRYR